MGDIVALVEKAAQEIDMKKAADMAAKMKKGQFDLDDLADQLSQMKKLGGMKGIMGMLPGMGKLKGQLDGLDEKIFDRQIAIVRSMTAKERRKPELLAASRKRRIAAGSGTRVEDVNKLLKMHRQMADMMKMMGKKKGGLFGGLGSMLGGGMPQIDPAELEAMAKSGQLPGGMGGLGGMGGGMPTLPKGMGLPGMGLPKGPLPPGFRKK
jgi:signal recognition particle subunit SRP54